MGRPYPAEFRTRAVALAREGGKSIRQLAADLGISVHSLHKWIRTDKIESGDTLGVTRSDQQELAALRRELRVTKTENEILKRAAAYFAKENVLPK